MSASVLEKETEFPEKIREDFRKYMKEDTFSISIERHCGLSNVWLDRYIEHQITTEKVIAGVLKDVSGL